MQKHLEQIEVELATRIYKIFLEKFNGNKSEFARASNCSETTVRRVFRNQQRMTVELLIKFCIALEIELSELIKGIHILDSKKDESN